MVKYKLIYHWSDGAEEEDDNYGDYFDTEEEAKDSGEVHLSSRSQGRESLYWSNPGDYSNDDYNDNDWFEVVEIDWEV
ncbi:MAG: hypothetical protein J5372_00580 [Lachnospiraceae bacterium]|nr:hypothetical protein [Lachnospiraceae bacterium]